MELLVAPRGTLRYTLDGSEPRNGTQYTAPIDIGGEGASIYVFAECDGLEAKKTFQFAPTGSKDIVIIKEKPAIFHRASPKRLDSATQTYDGLKMAREKNISFEQVSLMVGSAPKVIHLSLGEVKIDAKFIETELAHLQTLVSANAPVVMTFKKAYTATGFDLEQFTEKLGIDIQAGEVIQE